jgi:hypothetical protein
MTIFCKSFFFAELSAHYPISGRTSTPQLMACFSLSTVEAYPGIHGYWPGTMLSGKPGKDLMEDVEVGLNDSVNLMKEIPGSFLPPFSISLEKTGR